jgi:hypothetical protein
MGWVRRRASSQQPGVAGLDSYDHPRDWGADEENFCGGIPVVLCYVELGGTGGRVRTARPQVRHAPVQTSSSVWSSRSTA